MIFVGDDWAEDHHDVYVMDEAGTRVASRRLPKALTGIREVHELIAADAAEPDRVVIGIETGRGLWVEGAECGRLSGVCDQPAGGGALPPPPLGGPNPMRLTPNCWLIWCAPTGTTIAGSLATAHKPRRPTFSPAHIKN